MSSAYEMATSPCMPSGLSKLSSSFHLSLTIYSVSAGTLLRHCTQPRQPSQPVNHSSSITQYTSEIYTLASNKTCGTCDVIVRMSALQLNGRGLDSQLCRCQVTTLGKLFTGQWSPTVGKVTVDLESHWSRITLQWFIHQLAQSLRQRLCSSLSVAPFTFLPSV